MGLAVAALLAVANWTPGQAQQTPAARPAAETCGRADPSYIAIANQTGGQPMFLKRSEAGKIGQFMRESTGNNRETLFWATGTLNGGPRSFVVPVDSTIERVTFSLSVDAEGSGLALARPSGGLVAAQDPGTETTELACGRLVTIAAPEPGDWRVRIEGRGQFWFRASAKTEIFFVKTEFVKPGGRPGHEGMLRIAGQPLADAPANLEVRLSGPVASASFQLVTLGGEPIEPVRMTMTSSGEDDQEYSGTFVLPMQPFRLRVIGQDAKGTAFQRLFHNLFHAATVEVAPIDSALVDLPPGQTTPVRFTVRNVGAPATFRVTAVDSRRFLSRAFPQEITLATGQSGVVAVELTVPPGTPSGSGTDVTVTVNSGSSPAATNGASIHLTVFPARNP